MKKLICIFCVIFVFISLPVTYLYSLDFNIYLNNFFQNQLIPIMATVLALNFAMAASLQAILLNLEAMMKTINFKGSRKEISHNLLFMIIVFILTFILQIFDVPKYKVFTYFLISFKITLFILYFYAVFEISSGIFKISNNK